MDLEQQCKLAFENAKRTSIPHAIVSMDAGDSRVTLVVDLPYTDGHEFLAFDGRVEAIVHPDGAWE